MAGSALSLPLCITVQGSEADQLLAGRHLTAVDYCYRTFVVTDIFLHNSEAVEISSPFSTCQQTLKLVEERIDVRDALLRTA